eukprot:320949-Pleurochrysis_carterae.AAC.3
MLTAKNGTRSLRRGLGRGHRVKQKAFSQEDGASACAVELFKRTSRGRAESARHSGELEPEWWAEDQVEQARVFMSSRKRARVEYCATRE